MSEKVDIPIGEVISMHPEDGGGKYIVTNVKWQRQGRLWLAILSIEPYKMQADA
jgi:hypothetical protein